jgi:hypothetical protein
MENAFGQRIEAKIAAHARWREQQKSSHPARFFTTACAQACPTEDHLWRYQRSGGVAFQMKRQGAITDPRIFEHCPASQLSRAHSQSKSENAGREEHRSRKHGGEQREGGKTVRRLSKRLMGSAGILPTAGMLPAAFRETNQEDFTRRAASCAWTINSAVRQHARAPQLAI